MAKLNVNIGLSVNDKTGDTLRTAFDKINQNFTELYTLTGGTSTALTELAQDYAAPLFNHASHTNITATYDDANNKILLTGTPAQVQSNWTAVSGLGVVLNKPTLFSGSYTDLTSKPTLFSGSYTDLTSKPTLFSGSYTDLTSKPTIPTSFSSLVNGAHTLSLGSDSAVTLPNYNTGVGSKIKSAVDIKIQAGAYYLSNLSPLYGEPFTIVFSISSAPNWATVVAVGDYVISRTCVRQITVVAAPNAGEWRITVDSDDFTGASDFNGNSSWNFYKPGATNSIWTFGLNGTLTLPNSGELHPSTAAYDSALAGWESIRGDYITGMINANFVTAEGWPMVNWYPTGATAQGYIDFLFNARTLQNTAGATLIIQPPMSQTFYNEMRAALIAIRDSYNTSTKSVSLSSAYGKSWNFGENGTLTAIGNLQVGGGKIILNSAGNAYVESVDYGVDSANSAVNIFGGPYQKIKLRAGFGTQATWTLGTDGSITFPNATVQTTAYIAPTTGNSVINSVNPRTISRNGMTIRVTSTGMIQMSFNSVISITGRSSINNADSAVISSPNGATVSGTWYNIGAVLAVGDHLTATIVDASFHMIYRLTVIMRDKDTTSGSESAFAYAIIEQLQ